MDITTACAYLKRIEVSGTNGTIPPGTRSAMGMENAPMPVQIFSNEAAIFYLVDLGDSFTYVQQAHLDAAGMTHNELHEIAIANLDRLVPTLQVHDLGSQIMLSGNGNFEASMVLSPAFWALVGSRFPNGVAAALPARDVLALCDRDDDAALGQLRDASARVWNAGTSHLLAREIYEPTADGHWSPIAPLTAAAPAPLNESLPPSQSIAEPAGMSDEEAWQHKLTLDAADSVIEASFPDLPRVREPRMDVLLNDGTQFAIWPAYLVATGQRSDGLIEFRYIEVQAVEPGNEASVERIGDSEAVFLAAHLGGRVDRIALSGPRYEALFGDRQGIVTSVEIRGIQLVDA